MNNGVNGPGQWLVDNADQLTTPTILRTACPLILGTNSTIRVSNDVAVFADGGIALDSNLDLRSTASATRKLYLVQPYDAAPALNGQIYSGTTVTSDNQLTLNYVPLPAYGLTDGNGGGQDWKLDLLSKQEAN